MTGSFIGDSYIRKDFINEHKDEDKNWRLTDANKLDESQQLVNLIEEHGVYTFLRFADQYIDAYDLSKHGTVICEGNRLSLKFRPFNQRKWESGFFPFTLFLAPLALLSGQQSNGWDQTMIFEYNPLTGKIVSDDAARLYRAHNGFCVSCTDRHPPYNLAFSWLQSIYLQASGSNPFTLSRTEESTIDEEFLKAFYPAPGFNDSSTPDLETP